MIETDADYDEPVWTGYVWDGEEEQFVLASCFESGMMIVEDGTLLRGADVEYYRRQPSVRPWGPSPLLAGFA